MTNEIPVPASDVFVAMLQRDLRVARREIGFTLVRTLMQPTLLMIVFGYLLPKMQMLPPAYVTTLLPGVLAVSLALSAVQSVALPMVASFGATREIEDRLLAPLPTHLVALELVVVGVIQGVVAGLIVLPLGRVIMGSAPGLTLSSFGLTLGMMILAAAAFSTLGLWLGCAVNVNQIGLMFSFIVAPMLFFGCAYYPWDGLRVVPWLQKAVLVNPLVYASEGMRGVLTPGVPHMDSAVVAAVLTAVAVFAWWRGLKAFYRRAVG
ncbi:MAG: ABC transporter permease [Gemmatimonadota bacterium]